MSGTGMSMGTGMGTIWVSDVRPERVRWLWSGYLPLGKLAILDGDPGLGKTTMLLDLAARLTTARPMPDGSRPDLDGPANVLILTAEDGIADTIRPRLDAAEADVTRAAVWRSTPDAEGTQLLPQLPADLGALATLIHEWQFKLVIVDPLVAFLGPTINSYRDQDVRRALAPLATVAEGTGATMVLVRHLNKGSSDNALHRGGGSIGIIGAARAGLLVALDPDDAERRVLATTKQNLAKPVPALAYRLIEAPNGVARVQWEGATRHSASQLLAGPIDDEERGAVAEAAAVLRDILASGPVAAKEVRQQATAAGVSPRTLDRAKAQLGVRAIKAGYESGWQWILPTAAAAMKTKDANSLSSKNLASFEGSWRSSYSHAENEEEDLASFAVEERQGLASFEERQALASLAAEEGQSDERKTASDQEERQVHRRAPTFWDREELAPIAPPRRRCVDCNGPVPNDPPGLTLRCPACVRDAYQRLGRELPESLAWVATYKR